MLVPGRLYQATAAYQAHPRPTLYIPTARNGYTLTNQNELQQVYTPMGVQYGLLGKRPLICVAVSAPARDEQGAVRTEDSRLNGVVITPGSRKP